MHFYRSDDWGCHVPPCAGQAHRDLVHTAAKGALSTHIKLCPSFIAHGAQNVKLGKLGYAHLRLLPKEHGMRPDCQPRPASAGGEESALMA